MSQIAFWSWFVVGLVVATVLHEVGHLVSGLIVSLPVSRFVIGIGPAIIRWRTGNTLFEIRLVPFGGHVTRAASGSFSRHRLALFYLGGVLGNLSVIGTIVWLDRAGVAPDILRETGAPLVLAQILAIVGSLIPSTASAGGKRMGSDGLQLLRLFGLHRVGYAALLEPYRGGRTYPSTMSLASSRISYQINRWLQSKDLNTRRDIWKAFRDELHRGDMNPEEEMLVLDALVTDGLIYADPELRANFDEWSLRALKLGPEIRTLIGSRGSVLVELGRYDEGKALLEAVLSASDATPYDLFMSRVFLARAEHSLGSEAVSRDLMMKVREVVDLIDSYQVAMIERIEAEIAVTQRIPPPQPIQGHDTQQTRT